MMMMMMMKLDQWSYTTEFWSSPRQKQSAYFCFCSCFKKCSEHAASYQHIFWSLWRQQFGLPAASVPRHKENFCGSSSLRSSHWSRCVFLMTFPLFQEDQRRLHHHNNNRSSRNEWRLQQLLLVFVTLVPVSEPVPPQNHGPDPTTAGPGGALRDLYSYCHNRWVIHFLILCLYSQQTEKMCTMCSENMMAIKSIKNTRGASYF